MARTWKVEIPTAPNIGTKVRDAEGFIWEHRRITTGRQVSIRWMLLDGPESLGQPNIGYTETWLDLVMRYGPLTEIVNE